MEDIEKTEALCAVILRHMAPLDPDAIEQVKADFVSSDDINGGVKLEAILAHRILMYARYSRARWGTSQDGPKLQEIEYHLRKVKSLLEELSSETHWELVYGSKLHIQDDPKELHIELHAVSSEALRVIGFLRKFPHYRSAKRHKTNWKAASVAVCCREIWGTFRQGCYNPDKISTENTPTDAYEIGVLAWLELNAPLTVHNDRPGPMGNFIQDVFTLLDITNEEGEPIRAASALRAASKLMSKQ